MERLEMARIRLEAALDISCKWQTTDASLLRWRRKLKRVSRECDDALREHKRRVILQEAEAADERGTVTRWVAGAAWSIMQLPSLLLGTSCLA